VNLSGASRLKPGARRRDHHQPRRFVPSRPQPGRSTAAANCGVSWR